MAAIYSPNKRAETDCGGQFVTAQPKATDTYGEQTERRSMVDRLA